MIGWEQCRQRLNEHDVQKPLLSRPGQRSFRRHTLLQPRAADYQPVALGPVTLAVRARSAKWPRSVPIETVKPDECVDHLRITLVEHATLLIQATGVNLLTDPVWSERVSPVNFIGPKRVAVPGVAFEDLPPIDAVLLSYNHYDHLDLATLGRLHAAHAPLMVTPICNDAIIRAAVPAARIAFGDWRLAIGDWRDRIEIAGFVATTLTPATHWSARGILIAAWRFGQDISLPRPPAAFGSRAIPATGTGPSSATFEYGMGRPTSRNNPLALHSAPPTALSRNPC